MTHEYWLVASANSWNSPNCYRTREHAQARANLDNIEYPNIGPWVVIHVREVAPVAVAVSEAA